MEREEMTPAKLEQFLGEMEAKGRSPLSIKSYRRSLTALYEFLPEDKALTAGTAEAWREELTARELSPRSVGSYLSALNSYCRFIGRKAWVTEGGCGGTPENEEAELTRTEYLRLLQTAKLLGKEKAYLLTKTLGGAGLRVQELEQLTAEAVRRGTVTLTYHNDQSRRSLRLPDSLRQELSAYLRREGIDQGPVFRGGEGKALSGTGVYYLVSSLAQTARVPESHVNPRCLWKLYQATHEKLRANISALLEQVYDRLMDEEQQSAGWNAGAAGK